MFTNSVPYCRIKLFYCDTNICLTVLFRSHNSENDELPDPVKQETDVDDSQKDSESQSSDTRSRYKAPPKTLETKRPGKMPVAIKNVTDIEALELATEQTLKVSALNIISFTLIHI